MPKRPVLAYYALRGLCEPIRYLLRYKGVDYEDKFYETREDWFQYKFSMGLDFPNLPYYIDGDVKLTQSLAILRHLARKHGLDGRTDAEKTRMDVLEQQLVDLRTNLFKAIYDKDFEKTKADFVKNAAVQLKLLSDFIGDKKFFIKDEITYVDFLAYDAIDFYRYLTPAVSQDPKLKAFLDRFENLPGLKDYLTSPDYHRWPIAGPFAAFGGSEPEPKKL